MNGNGSLDWFGGLFGMAVCAGVIASGVYLLRTSAEQLLRWDRRTGYWHYQRELKASGDARLALAVAGRFYRALGLCFVIMASGLFLFSLYQFVSSLVSN